MELLPQNEHLRDFI